MVFQTDIDNLPYFGYFGYFFILYFLLAHTSLPKYIRRGALIYHRHSENRIHHILYGKDLHKDIYDIDGENDINEPDANDQVTSDQVTSDQVINEPDINEPNISEVQIEKFEDKYLAAFKSFSNDYFFTEEELKEKADKFEQLKHVYECDKEFSLTDLDFLLSQTIKIVDLIDKDDLKEEMQDRLIKYFDLEAEFAEDPSNFDLDELLNDVKNDHNRFTSEKNNLFESKISDAEFLDKALQHVLDKKLDGFINNYILEYTPLGNVYMRYNNFKKSFEYFSNNTIPYRYLEAIGRKYVMTFRCKALFVDLEEEMQKAAEREEKEEKDPKPLKNPTTKFKSYNRDIKMSGRPGSNNNNREILGNATLVSVNTSGEKQLLKENANRYTWEGRLANFSVLKKVDRKTVDKNYALSFADFKQMSQIKK
jgi:hypothetical protein